MTERPRAGSAAGFKDVSDGAPEAAASECMKRDTLRHPVRRFLPATPVSLRQRALRERWRAPPQTGSCTPSDLRCRSHDCRSACLPPAPCEPGSSNPRTPHGANPPSCVPHRHARRLDQRKRGGGPPPRRRPRFARGRPFSADPDRGTLRPFPTTRAGPASLPRLTAYPRAERGDCRRRFGGWGKRGWAFSEQRFPAGLGFNPTARRRGFPASLRPSQGAGAFRARYGPPS